MFGSKDRKYKELERKTNEIDEAISLLKIGQQLLHNELGAMRQNYEQVNKTAGSHDQQMQYIQERLKIALNALEKLEQQNISELEHEEKEETKKPRIGW